MKEKITALFLTLKEHKKIVIPIIATILLVIILAIAIIVATSGPKNYDKKIKEVTKALSSESKMKTALNKYIDSKAAVAWIEAEQDSKDFKKEYKKIKKNSEDVKDFEDALKNYAEDNEDNDDYKMKVSNIKKPKKDSKNKNISTVTATLSLKNSSSYSSYLGVSNNAERQVKFVFYKNKIIDIIDKDSKESLFESIAK